MAQNSHNRTQAKSLFTADLVLPAIKASFVKLNPKELVRNPVMFVTATVATLMTVLLVVR
jgi:K+-transporting ATPase ATPase B chain